MQFLADLWLPIVLAAVLVFVVSSVLHMVLPIHKSDYKQISGEEKVLEAMREQVVVPGDYNFPYCASMKDMATPEISAKYDQGPVGFMTVLPSGPPAIGKSLIQWFLYSLFVGVMVAYIASLGLSHGSEYMKVFQMTGAIAVMAYGFADIPTSIWKGVSWKTTCKFVFDGIIYGLVTAGTFAWLWPGT